MLRKTCNIYIRILEVIIEKIEELVNFIVPRTVIIDFEKAEEKAFLHVFGDNIVLHGCYFHFAQSIWRKVQSLGMSEIYGNNENYNKIIKKFIALSLCEVEDIVNRFDLVSREFINNFQLTLIHQTFLDYFQTTWV